MESRIKNLHINLRTERIARGLSQQQLADACGMTRQEISRFERGERNIGYRSLVSIVEAMGLHIEITTHPDK